MKQLLGVVLLLLTTGSAWAQAMDLGKVRVPVNDRSEDVRDQAMSQGLHVVVNRLTGQKDASGYPGLKSMFDNPATWVLQFGYESTDSGQGQTAAAPGASDQQTSTGTAPAPGNSGLILSMDFDVKALSGKLEDLGAPVWGTDRPPVLFWVVLQGPGAGQFVTTGGPDDDRTVLQQEANRRGLPMVLPDGSDSLQPADVRGLFDQQVMNASGRYKTPLIVTAVLYEGSSPRLRWRLLQDGSMQRQGELEGGAGQDMLAQMVDQVTDYLVGLYAVRSGAGRSLSVRIHGLRQLPDWKQLHDFLAGIAGVKALQLVALQNDTVTFSARFSGDRAQFRRLAALNPHLDECDQGGNVENEVQSDSGTTATAGASGGQQDQAAEPRIMDFCWRNGR